MIGPKGWVVGGTSDGLYAGDVDAEVRSEGAASGTLRSVQPPPSAYDFGVLSQGADAGTFRGQRVRFSAMVRTRGVKDWAGLWLRVDGPNGADGQPLAFDNMHDRPIEGDTEWTREAIVLEVPSTASGLAYGLLLTGEGQAWLDDVRIERVGPDVPTTVDPEWVGSHLEPFNTTFELKEAP
jgi:hypothetical protein